MVRSGRGKGIGRGGRGRRECGGLEALENDPDPLAVEGYHLPIGAKGATAVVAKARLSGA